MVIYILYRNFFKFFAPSQFSSLLTVDPIFQKLYTLICDNALRRRREDIPLLGINRWVARHVRKVTWCFHFCKRRDKTILPALRGVLTVSAY